MTARFARFLASDEAVANTNQLGMEFPSMDALKKYLHIHPGADPKNHSVEKKDDKEKGGEGGESKLPPKIKERQEEVEDFMDTWEKAEEFAGHKLEKPEKLKEIGKKIEDEEKSGKPRPDDEAKRDSEMLWKLLDKEVSKAVDQTGKEWNYPEKAKKHQPKQQEWSGLTASANKRVRSRRIVARFLQASGQNRR